MTKVFSLLSVLAAGSTLMLLASSAFAQSHDISISAIPSGSKIRFERLITLPAQSRSIQLYGWTDHGCSLDYAPSEQARQIHVGQELTVENSEPAKVSFSEPSASQFGIGCSEGVSVKDLESGELISVSFSEPVDAFPQKTSTGSVVSSLRFIGISKITQNSKVQFDRTIYIPAHSNSAILFGVSGDSSPNCSLTFSKSDLARKIVSRQSLTIDRVKNENSVGCVSYSNDTVCGQKTEILFKEPYAADFGITCYGLTSSEAGVIEASTSDLKSRGLSFDLAVAPDAF